MRTTTAGPYLGGLVYGVVLVAVGVLVLLYEVTVIRVDWALLLPLGLVATGALLTVGGVLTAMRRSPSRPDAG